MRCPTACPSEDESCRSELRPSEALSVAVGFALSCFGLVLFLWIAFGGPIPLKPKSYRITAYFPEATQLATGVGRADQRRLASAR